MPKRTWKKPGFQRRTLARIDYPGPDAAPAQAPLDTNSARRDAPLVREYTRGDPRVALQIASDPDRLQDAVRRLESSKWAAGGASTQAAYRGSWALLANPIQRIKKRKI